MSYRVLSKNNTILKLTELPKDSTKLVQGQKIFIPLNTDLDILEVLDHKDNHLRVVILPFDDPEHPIKDKTIAWLYIPHFNLIDLPDDLFYVLPLPQLIDILGHEKDKVKLANTYIEGLNKALVEFEITTPKRMSSFLAQVCHESGGFVYSEELASGQAYEGRKDLGNIYAGDGKRFKGRGLIQLTGRHNYSVAGKVLNIDLINLPQKASDPTNAPRIAGWFWHTRNLNQLADQHNIPAFQAITKKINGGLNGYKDRLNWWTKTRKVLGC